MKTAIAFWAAVALFLGLAIYLLADIVADDRACREAGGIMRSGQCVEVDLVEVPE